MRFFFFLSRCVWRMCNFLSLSLSHCTWKHLWYQVLKWFLNWNTIHLVNLNANRPLTWEGQCILTGSVIQSFKKCVLTAFCVLELVLWTRKTMTWPLFLEMHRLANGICKARLPQTKPLYAATEVKEQTLHSSKKFHRLLLPMQGSQGRPHKAVDPVDTEAGHKL